MKVPYAKNYRPAELLVRLRSQQHELSSQDLLQEHGLKLIDRFELKGDGLDAAEQEGDILHLKLAAGQTVEQMQKELAQDPRVAYTATNDILQSFGEVRPDDLSSGLWGLSAIQAPQAWSITTGDRDSAPLVGVIDSGIDYNHPELKANIWTNPNEVANGVDDDGNGIVDDLHGYDAAGRDGDPMDDGSHGTHVGGTIAAAGNDGPGVVGVAWQAQLMPLKFLSGGFGDIASAIAAIQYADSQGVRITSNSWGGSNYNQALKDVLAASPALHICAAGNSGNDSDTKPLYPAAYDLDNIVSVAATDSQDQLAGFSNYGAASVDLAAPGKTILSTIPNGEYGIKSGTSMATPHVTGVASLVAGRFPGLSNAQLKDRLLFSSDRLPQLEGKLVSGGRLNAARALENDPVAPARVTELSVDEEATTDTSVTVRWTAPGDDGVNGTAAAYEMRWAEFPLDEENFERGIQVAVAAPGEAGAAQQAQIELVPSGRERNLHIAVRAVDNVGNRAALSSLQAAVPAAKVAFEDDGERGDQGWQAEGDWALTPYPGRGLVWSDSPDGSYERDLNASLTSPAFSLAGFEKPELSFDVRHDLEINFDKLFVEVSGDGENWNELDKFNLLENWSRKEYDLSDFAEQPEVRFRFRLKTDGDVFKDGVYLDNIVVSEKG